MTNHLTIAAVDPESNEPNYKQCAVGLAAPEAAPETADDSAVRTDEPMGVNQ
jgi:assimilatory nitrate reductase catalytic subunit